MGQPYTVGQASRILGVQSSAPVATIRRAFRRLALQHHPDRNPGDGGAPERFRALCDAYRFLKEQSARKAETESTSTDPFAPKPIPRYPSAFRREKMYYPTPAEIADLNRPARFRPTKWLGWFCGMLLLGTVILSLILERTGGYIGPGKPWVQEFLKHNGRRY
jgi:curved DNA-binding protein CbpA